MATAATAKAAPATLHDSFAKSIKKDQEAYPAFKEARFWDTWNREFQINVHLHDFSNVLESGYLPDMAEEHELFELQKRFMYSVFLSKITVADGAHIVKSIPDAQECYEALVHRFSHSPKATMDANTIREKIHALKLDKSWRGTATKFLRISDPLVGVDHGRPCPDMATENKNDNTRISSVKQ